MALYHQCGRSLVVEAVPWDARGREFDLWPRRNVFCHTYFSKWTPLVRCPVVGPFHQVRCQVPLWNPPVRWLWSDPLVSAVGLVGPARQRRGAGRTRSSVSWGWSFCQIGGGKVVRSLHGTRLSGWWTDSSACGAAVRSARGTRLPGWWD
jgi:hypothetical protein